MKETTKKKIFFVGLVAFIVGMFVYLNTTLPKAHGSAEPIVCEGQGQGQDQEGCITPYPTDEISPTSNPCDQWDDCITPSVSPSEEITPTEEATPSATETPSNSGGDGNGQKGGSGVSDGLSSCPSCTAAPAPKAAPATGHAE